MAKKKDKFYQKIINKQELNNPYKYIGKCDRIAVRSSWELKFLKFCDNNEYILEWSSEDFAIKYVSPVDKREHKYYPDFFVKAITANDKINHFCIEIKPYKETIYPKVSKTRKTSTNVEAVKRFLINQAKWKSARDFCKQNDMKFQILTENELGI